MPPNDTNQSLSAQLEAHNALDAQRATTKVPRAWPYFLAYLLHVFVLLGWYLGGKWNYLTICFAFVVIPALDLVVGLDEWNPTKEQERVFDKMLNFRFATWLWLPLQLISIALACIEVQNHPEWSWHAYIGFTVAVGLIGGLGINVAHELIHKHPVYEQIMGRLILLSSCYGHFQIEHIRGHHKLVSTPDDPASADLNENVYSFYIRSVTGSFLSAWNLEAQRLKKAGLSTWSLGNEILQDVFISFFLLPLGIYKYIGFSAVIFFFLQSWVAFTLLELVNYIEHYGLRRNLNEHHEYERVTPIHSWNAGHRVTNYFLFKLQRHSDHHAFASRRYQILRTWSASPQLPTGYAGMILCSLCPPIFFKIMNPRVAAVRAEAALYAKSGLNPFQNVVD